MRFAVLPQVLSNFLSYALLRFEINVRGASVMGFVGAGGIGQDLMEAIRKFYYPDVSAILRAHHPHRGGHRPRDRAGAAALHHGGALTWQHRAPTATPTSRTPHCGRAMRSFAPRLERQAARRRGAGTAGLRPVAPRLLASQVPQRPRQPRQVRRADVPAGLGRHGQPAGAIVQVTGRDGGHRPARHHARRHHRPSAEPHRGAQHHRVAGPALLRPPRLRHAARASTRWSGR